MIFEVTDEQIESLKDDDLRSLVALLCQQEVRAHGHSTAAVTAGGNQNAADGGIDVRVDLPAGTAISGYVPKPATGFQVKAQDMPHSAILDEMRPKGVFRPSISALALAKGAYIIVTSKGSLADTALSDRRKAMREAVMGVPSADHLALDVYDRHRVATWVNQHPALIPWVREKVGQPLSGWLPFRDWSSSPADAKEPYLVDDRLRLLSPSISDASGLNAVDGINALRRVIQKPGGVVRLVGLSGVGKTRLAQALFDDRIGSASLDPLLAIYADISDSPDPVPLELASWLVALGHRAILIIDNCPPGLHHKLTIKVREPGSKLSLLTVEYDISDDEPEHTDIFKLEVASVELIERILEVRFPEIATPSRRVIAEFSDGNARIAFALAATARNGDSVANLKDKDLFKRLFEQAKGPDENLLNAAKVCALAYSFNGETLEGPNAELPVLSGLAGISPGQLFSAVAELMRRKLIQRRGKWRALLPHALAHRLAKLALEDIPRSRIDAAIVRGPSTRLLKSFSRRLGYMHDVPEVQQVVADWLARGGLLGALGTLNRLGIEMLANIAPVDPQLTLSYIEDASERSADFFSKQNANRSEIIKLLRSIAYDATHFERCVALLRSFVQEPIDGQDQDSASNVLKSLFPLFLSGTHATIAQRIAFVRQELEGATPESRKLGLALLDKLLQTSHFTSHYSFDFGARTRDYGLHPRGPAITDWFKQALEFSRDVVLSGHPAGSEVRRLIAVHIGELATRTRLIDEIDSMVRDIAGAEPWPECWIAVRSALRRSRQTAPSELIGKLENLAKSLQPSDLTNLVRSYGLSREWSPLDVAKIEGDDDHDDDENSTDPRERILEFCVELGRRLESEPEALERLLPEIFGVHGQRVGALGRGLAESCRSVRETWTYLATKFLECPEKTRQASFLGGYLEGVLARDADEGKAILDGLLTNPETHPYFMYLHAYAGIESIECGRLLKALDIATVPTHSFKVLESGRLHEGLDDEQLAHFLRKLCTREGGVLVAVEILGMRYHGLRDEKESLSKALKDLGIDLVARIRLETRNHHDHHMLPRVVEGAIEGPEDYEAAFSLCERIAEALRMYSIHPWDVDDTVRVLAKVCPRAVLDVLVENGDSEDHRSIFREVRESRPDPLGDIPETVLLGWADEKPDIRYPRLAEVLRFSDATNDDDASKVWSPRAMKVIDLSPNPSLVLDAFRNRFYPMSWSGSRAVIMASRITLIEALLKHSRPEVMAWAIAALPAYRADVDRERTSEALRDKARDERFE